MFHLLQLLLKLLLQVEGELPDNSRLASSIFIGGVWLILIAEIFPRQLGPWRDWCFWGGWICAGLAAFLIHSQEDLEMAAKAAEEKSFHDLEVSATRFDEAACGSYTPREQRTLRAG